MTMFPAISILSGLHTIVRELGFFGTGLSLIVTYPVFTLPFTVWVLTSFFRGLPAAIEQAAIVDGATPFQTFRLILLPLTAPGLVTTGLLAFVQSWSEYLFAFNFTATNPSAQTEPVAIAKFSGQFSEQEPIAEIMAAAMVLTIPLVVLVLIYQTRIVEGLTAGAVKGSELTILCMPPSCQILYACAPLWRRISVTSVVKSSCRPFPRRWTLV